MVKNLQLMIPASGMNSQGIEQKKKERKEES